MSKPLKPLDVQQRLGAAGVWAVDMPKLDETELAQLIDLVPSLETDARQEFERGAQRIFSRTVDNLMIASNCVGSPAVHARDQLRKFVQAMALARDAIDGLDDGVMRLLHARLSELTIVAQKDRVGCRITSQKWRRDTLRLLDLIVGVGEDIEIVPVRRESGTVYRQMTRDLANLLTGITGAPPKRAFRHESGHSNEPGDHYWFLELSRRFAALAHARALTTSPPPIRLEAPTSLTGIVREELDAISDLWGPGAPKPNGAIKRRGRR